MSDEGLSKQLQTAFKLVCRKCESENVVIDYEAPTYYSALTGYGTGTLSIGCNNCKQNDFFHYL